MEGDWIVPERDDSLWFAEDDGLQDAFMGHYSPPPISWSESRAVVEDTDSAQFLLRRANGYRFHRHAQVLNCRVGERVRGEVLLSTETEHDMVQGGC